MTQSTTFRTEWDQLFIGGKWAAPSSAEVIEVRSPATGEIVGKVPLAVAADVDAACAAARKAFDEGPWPKMSPTERAVVCVGRICRQKGQDVLLDAWSRLPGDDRSLTLVGGGPDLDSLRERWSSPDIRFTGETDRRTALDWMAAADLVVLPSRWEGLALVPLESLAVGTPVVATDVNGTREVLTEGVGSVVPIEDSVRLAAAIEEWLKKLGGDGVHQRCRNRVAESFDLTDTVTRIDRALLEISGGGR